MRTLARDKQKWKKMQSRMKMQEPNREEEVQDMSSPCVDV